MASSSAFQYIKLKEDDVPGAKLIYPEIENHSNDGFFAEVYQQVETNQLYLQDNLYSFHFVIKFLLCPC